MDEPKHVDAPCLEDIREARRSLGDRIVVTPSLRFNSSTLDRLLGSPSQVFLKLELFQRTGTFKARGALLNLMQLDPGALGRGVTAVSAGNHAMAVSFAAAEMGSTAKVVMPSNANPARVNWCRSIGAEVVLVSDVHEGFAKVREIEELEGRTFVHPFDGPNTVVGTATLGVELMEQVPELDLVLVPIGGGGLSAGVAAAVKQISPECLVIGVEPEGADSMHRSFEAGSPQSIDKVRTIADSLGAPHAAAYTFGLCQRFIDELVRVDDNQIREAMLVLFEEAKIAVEPAGAAATAALCGPLANVAKGKRCAVIVCGSNIDSTTFSAYLDEAQKRRLSASPMSG